MTPLQWAAYEVLRDHPVPMQAGTISTLLAERGHHADAVKVGQNLAALRKRKFVMKRSFPTGSEIFVRGRRVTPTKVFWMICPNTDLPPKQGTRL